VKLVGYCIEDDQRLLVYEFMPRGSLENHLFRSKYLLILPLLVLCNIYAIVISFFPFYRLIHVSVSVLVMIDTM
jgi:hypothetical protein